MKKQIKSFLSLVSFMAVGVSSMVWADAPTAPAQLPLADASEAIVAEVNVTHDMVDQMLRRLSTQSSNIEFNARDYRAKSARFQAQVARLMQEFETQLKDSILHKLEFWAQRYNSIYRSTTLSAEQKTALLNQQRSIVLAQTRLIEQEYRQAIRRIYQSVGDLPLEMSLREVSVRSLRFLERRRHACDQSYLEVEYKSPASGRSVKGMVCGTPGLYGLLGNRYEVIETQGGLEFRMENRRDYLIFPLSEGAYPEQLNGLSRYRGYERPSSERFDIYYSNSGTRMSLLWLNSQTGLNFFTEAFAGFEKQKIFQEVVFPMTSQGCRSQICLALSASEVLTYLSLIQTSIDREIKVSLADGSAELKIRPTYLDLGAISSLISMTDYPASAQNLPFDTE